MEDFIILKALEIDGKKFINASLKESLNKLENKKIDQIFDFTKNKEYNQIEKFVIDIYHSSYEENRKVQEISGLISLGVYFFKKSINENNFTFLLIFLMINLTLGISPKDLIKSKKIIHAECYCLIDDIIYFLQNQKYVLKFNYSTIDDALIFDFKHVKFHEIYDFVSPNSRENMTYGFLFEELINFVLKIDFKSFLKLYSSADTPQKAILYLNFLNEEDLIKVASELDLKNKWLNFELLRNILICIGEDNLRENKKILDILTKMIYKIYKSDFNFFNQTINYFRNYKMFHICLGIFLAKCNQNELNKICKECLTINLVKNDSNSPKKQILLKDLLLDKFKNNSNNEKYEYFIKLIYQKWKNYLKNFIKINDNTNTIIITDYHNYIIQYYNFFTSKNFIITQLKRNFKKMKYNNYKWYSNNTDLMTYFFIYLTNIYLLSFAYNYKKLDNNEIKKEFLDFKENKLLHQKFGLNHIDYELKILEKNLL